MLDKDGYREYTIAGVVIKAKLSPAAIRYDVILPSGERMRVQVEIFEKMATEVKP